MEAKKRILPKRGGKKEDLAKTPQLCKWHSEGGGATVVARPMLEKNFGQ